ncbi:MAG TPA: FAD-binding oxidoreductase [Bacillota bacterium]
MKSTADVVIIGGGVNGTAVAYNLAARGCGKVVVLEKNTLASGSTGRCGAGVRMQWGMEMNCRLAKGSIERFETLGEELGFDGDLEFKQGGYLMPAYTERQWRQFKQNVALQNRLDIPSRLVTREETLAIVPHLSPEGLLGAAFCPKDGHLNPFKTVQAYAEAAARLGVTIRKFAAVTAIIPMTGLNKRVVLSNGDEVETPIVVNTAGPYSQVVGRMAGVELPVHSERHQILVTEPVGSLQGPMVMSFAHGLYCQQTPHGSFIMGVGDPHEPRGFDIGHSWSFLEDVAAKVTEIMPILREVRVVRQWSGLYNMTPDAQPILGEVSEVPGFFQAIGFSGHGFMLAPMTGILLAELILGLKTSLDVSMLTLDRFVRGELIREPSVV